MDGVRSSLRYVEVTSQNVEEVLSWYFGWNATLVRAAIEFGCTVDLYPEIQLIGLHYKKRLEFFSSMNNPLNSAGAVPIAWNKFVTSQLLKRAGIVVAQSVNLYRNKFDPKKPFSIPIHFPVVLKPTAGTEGGTDVLVNINSMEELQANIVRLFKHHPQLLVEKYKRGFQEYRVLVLDGKVIGATHRVPAYIKGNGTSTIAELIEQKNVKRAEKPFVKTKPIPLDTTTKKRIRDKGYTLKTVLSENEKLVLQEAANSGLGGEFYDVTDEICKENAELAVRATQALGLRIAGLDILAKNISKPIQTMRDGVLIEVNEYPGITCHSYPHLGKARPVEKMIIEALFK